NEGIFSGTPTNDEVGSYWVNVSIDDGEDGSDFTNFTLAVLNVNDQPLIITEDKLTASVGELYEVDYNATDIDSPISEQIWSLNTNATWLRLSSDTGVLSGLPTLSDEGWYTVNVSVDDGDGGQDWNEFILIVEKIIDLNLPPLITTIDVVSITAEELYYVDYDAVDDRTPFNLLMWSFNTDASWLSFDKTTGALTGTPSLSDVGSYWVNVTVGDGEGGFNYHNFTLTVYSTANQPPEITTEDKSVTEVNKTYSIDYEATDDRTPINYLQWDLNTNASWLTIDTNTGVLSGTPELADVGIYWVNVSVTDGEDGWDYHDFKLRVLTESQIEENTAPELSNPEMTPSEGDTGTEFTFTVHYYDADGNEPAAIQLKIDGYTYNMDLKPTENPSNGVYECSIRLSEGPHTYYFNASDGLEIVNTDNITTPYIEKVSEVKDKVTEEKISWEIIIFIVILVIIMLLIIIDIIIRVKKKTEEETVQEPVEELLPPVPEEPVVEIPPPEPEVPKAPSATTPPVPLTEQPPQYATQPTQPSVPPSVTSKTFESPSTVSPTVAPPAVTQPPPTVPKVEPPERTLPEDATSEK
ncbi:MAG: putative Ig domain-containing protein, partial [Thermoplasmata archaeon]|nr:putative Ig domain-containing protein [Thermoplasmata archaeon]